MREATPDFKFDIRLQDNYIRAESTGTETPDTMIYIYEEIIKKVIEWDCNRVLYIEGLLNQISIQDMLIAWRKIFRTVEDNNISGRIAVFDRNQDDYTINLVSESLANARGIEAKVFNDIDTAIEWLKR